MASDAETDHDYRLSRRLGEPWCDERGCLNRRAEHRAAQDATGVAARLAFIEASLGAGAYHPAAAFDDLRWLLAQTDRVMAELAAATARAERAEARAGVIVSREWDDEIRARDHSLRQAGAFVLRLFDALAAQDQAIGSGRANRSTPLGELLHDCAPLIANYHARTAAINRLRAERATLAEGA